MPQNYYRYAIARERDVLKRRRGTYHGLVFSAHIASYYRKSCSELVSSLRKPYLIDPFTFIFARDPRIIRRTERDADRRVLKDHFGRRKKGEIKKSFARLAEEFYGDKVRQLCQRGESISPATFRRQDDVVDFVKCVLNFQDNVFAVSRKYDKYQKYTGRDLSDNSKPEALIAPYFFNDPSDSTWIKCNLDMVKTSRQTMDQHDDSRELWAIMCIHKNQLTSAPSMANDLKAAGADGVWIWVHDFRDTSASQQDLSEFHAAISSISQQGTPIGNLYSGAFSVLCSRLLDKLSCGPCYGEARSVDQDADDAVIPERYYFTDLLKKILLSNFSAQDLEERPSLLCDCDVCVNSSHSATFGEEDAREHFLLVRSAELAKYSTMPQSELVNKLQISYDKYKSDPIFDSGHLRNWIEAIR